MKRWKIINGFENYKVSNDGEVMPIIRKHSNITRLKPFLCARYLKVSLYKDKKMKPCFIHRLVAEQFVPNRKKLMFVNHKDGDKMNNHFLNLEWCTAKQNSKHAFAIGLMKNCFKKGRAHWNYKHGAYVKKVEII